MWTQAKELQWIDGLGSHSSGKALMGGFSADYLRLRKIVCLEGYIKSLGCRKRWFSGAKPLDLKDRAMQRLEHARKKAA